jgi:hypothetical protein
MGFSLYIQFTLDFSGECTCAIPHHGANITWKSKTRKHHGELSYFYSSEESYIAWHMIYKHQNTTIKLSPIYESILTLFS